MALKQAAKKLGYDDISHLEENIKDNMELWPWWELIKELINK